MAGRVGPLVLQWLLKISLDGFSRWKHQCQYTHTVYHHNVASHYVAVIARDDLLHKFWEMEENPKSNSNLSLHERIVLQHFNETHTHTDSGRLILRIHK